MNAMLSGTVQSWQQRRGWQPGALPSASAVVPGAGEAEGKRLQRLLRRSGRRLFCSIRTGFYRQGNARHGCLGGAVRDSECSARSRSAARAGLSPAPAVAGVLPGSFRQVRCSLTGGQETDLRPRVKETSSCLRNTEQHVVGPCFCGLMRAMRIFVRI